MLFGIGAGWNLEEMRNHGTDPATRFGLMRERVEAIKVIWTEEEAEYHGKHVDFDPIFSWPKPLQEGGPPVLVAGNAPKVLDRVLAYGDGWYPNRMPDAEAFIAQIEDLQRRGEESGRGRIPVSLQVPPRDPAMLERYENAGVTRTVHMLMGTPTPEEGEAKLDEWAARKDAYRG